MNVGHQISRNRLAQQYWRTETSDYSSNFFRTLLKVDSLFASRIYMRKEAVSRYRSVPRKRTFMSILLQFRCQEP